MINSIGDIKIITQWIPNHSLMKQFQMMKRGKCCQGKETRRAIIGINRLDVIEIHRWQCNVTALPEGQVIKPMILNKKAREVIVE